jgi:hypothetical protein
MTFLEAILALALAAEIHESNEAVTLTAQRCLDEIPWKYQGLLSAIVESSSPLFDVKALIKTMPDSIITKIGVV